MVQLAAFWGMPPQQDCVFCDGNWRTKVLFENERIVAIDNIRKAGQDHWLIIPLRHIRDIESVELEDRSLLEEMDTLKNTLLAEHYPDVPKSEVLTGYHRGHRPVVGTFGLPDIISVHHLHLHVIIYPHVVPRLWKYPYWNSLVFLSDEVFMQSIRGTEAPVAAAEAGSQEGEDVDNSTKGVDSREL